MKPDETNAGIRAGSPAEKISPDFLKAHDGSFEVVLHRFRSVLVRKGWILVLTVAIGVLCAWVHLRKVPGLYVSYGRMMMTGQIKLDEGLYSEDGSNFLGTQMELMRSGEVRSAAEALVASQHPELHPAPAFFEVAQSLNASVFNLKVTSSDGEYATALLDAIMKSYTGLKAEVRSHTSEKTLTAITGQLKSLESELRDGEAALLEFQRNNSVVILQQQGDSAGQYLAKLNADLSRLQTEYNLLRMLDIDQNLQRTKEQGALQEAKGGDDGPQLTGPETRYLDAREQAELLQAKLDGLLRVLQPSHPKVIEVKDEIAHQNNLIAIYKKQSLQELASKREGIRIEIENLKEVINEWQVKALDASQRMAEYDQLKQKVDRDKNLFDHLSASVPEIDLSRSVNPESVTTLEYAGVAVPIQSRKKVLLNGAGFGLVAGLLILMLLNYTDDRLHSIAEVEEKIHKPIIGQVPQTRAGKNILNTQISLSVKDQHSFAESFKNIRSSLFSSDSGSGGSRVLLVGSAVPHEGKSTIALNVAVTLALGGKRTLLVDGDLRRGVLHCAFEKSATPGLSEVISNELPFVEATRSTAVENLFLLTRGEVVAQPGELLLRPRLTELLGELRRNYDYVIIDSAPILAADDTTSLALKVDAVVCVVRLGFTQSRLFLGALKLLTERRAHVLGLVLNYSNSGPDRYYYRYSQYFTALTSRVKAPAPV